MKTLVTNYTFNASAKTVTFNGFTSIDLEKILVITNVTDNIIIYNFADSTKGGTVATNVLTLTYDTTSMSNTDKLQIWYDDTANSPATAANQARLEDAIDAIYYLAKNLDWLSQTKVVSSASGQLPAMMVQTSGSSAMGSISYLQEVNQLTYLGVNSTSSSGTTGRGRFESGFLIGHTGNMSAALSTINNIIVS